MATTLTGYQLLKLLHLAKAADCRRPTAFLAKAE